MFCNVFVLLSSLFSKSNEIGEGDEGVNKAVLKIKSEEIQIVFSFTNDYICSF